MDGDQNAVNFPAPKFLIPVLSKVFPVKLRREFAGSGCEQRFSSWKAVLSRLEIADFPVKFPVSGEFDWSPVRLPLGRQPFKPT
ncbi:hypothetical protein [Bradyrhizobium sp. SYSU BS000235]|uniref:hypothetical protein n=1 Tax=Bradyrhizobium sp. SYSU BS000235 TaxID=3411332 RepID=UPI003C7330C0